MRLLASLYLAAAAIAPVSLAAQAAPIVGTWNVEWEMGRTMTNGEATSILAKGTMKVVASGDSLLATFTATSRSDGEPITRPPFTIGGKATAKGAVFAQVSEITVNVNGEERKQRAVGTWTLEIAGDQLTGTVKREIEGATMDLPPSAVKGTRAG